MSGLRDWLGFNRRERRASLILIVLIIVIFLVKSLLRERKIPVEYYVIASSAEKGVPADTIPPYFDPNISSYDEMIKAGLSPRQVKSIISYREKGGRFRKPEDLAKIYTIDSADLRDVIPYIIIKSEPSSCMNMTELNSAAENDLERLPGIGPVLAARIIRYRNLLGGFAEPSQLGEVYGIGDSLSAILAKSVRTDTLLIRKVKINQADFDVLARHPYIGKENAEVIEGLRSRGYRFRSMKDLTDTKGTEFRNSGLLRYYLDFSD